MAILTAHSTLNLTAIPELNDGNAQVVTQTSTQWTVTDGNLTESVQGTGFAYSEHDIEAGTATGWELTLNGAPLLTITGMNYIFSGPGSPTAVVGHDIYDYGYLVDTGYPIYGTQADMAWMLRGDDQVNGSTGNDYLAGYEGNDNIAGNGGNDILRGWMGDDTLDGGAGVDTAAYLDFRDNVSVIKTSTGWSTMGAAEYDGLDTLAGVERLVFLGGQGKALDLDGNAGTVVKLIGAILGPAAVGDHAYVGIGLQFADTGMSAANLATFAMNAIGVISNDQVVETLWSNVIGGEIDPGNRAHYVGMLQNGMTRGELAVMAADTSFNTGNINLTGIAQVGIDYTLQTALPPI